jgi:Zn-dependent M28 family amino/carboxypeptidase
VNVVAELPGTLPEAAHRRYYVVGHYDSRNSDGADAEGDAPGANDDASGTAIVMELARALANVELDATVVFLCTAGEEQGLYGARYHVESALARGETIAGVLSLDIVGDPSVPPGVEDLLDARRHVRVFSQGVPRQADAQALSQISSLGAESDSVSRQLARLIAETGRQEQTPVQAMLVFRNDRFLRGGDHTPFVDAGIPPCASRRCTRTTRGSIRMCARRAAPATAIRRSSWIRSTWKVSRCWWELRSCVSPAPRATRQCAHHHRAARQ